VADDARFVEPKTAKRRAHRKPSRRVGGLSWGGMMAYVLLDGYDLGVGVLLYRAGGRESDEMVNAPSS